MDLETDQTNATTKLSILKKRKYEMWRLRIEQYFEVQDYALWDVLENGNSFKPTARTTANADGTSTSMIPGPVTTERRPKRRMMNQDCSRRTMNVEETSSKAMVAIDGACFDWSFMAERNRKGVGFVSYNDAPPPSTGLFAPPTIDLSNSGLEEFQQPEFEGYGPKTSKSVYKDTSNEVKKTPDAPLVNTAKPKVVNTARPTLAVVNAVRANQAHAGQHSNHTDFKKLDGGLDYLREEPEEVELLVKDLKTGKLDFCTPCNAFEKLMHEKFQMSSIGELTFFLGLQVQQKKDGIFISQDKYVAEILKKFGFTEVKTASTPMETQKPLLKDKDGEEVDVHMYRSMIGSLMCLTSSRPDIMFVVCACARYQVNLKVSHIHVVKRIFRYLKGQPKLGLWYPKDSPFDLVAYTDSDYAGASLDRRSTTGGKNCQWGSTVTSPNGWKEDHHYRVDSYTDGQLWYKTNLDKVKGAIPTDPQHTPTILHPSTSQPQKTQTPRELTRIDTEIPQSSGPTEHVADEAVYKERGDSLVRDASTASCLEAEQDSGNITKTRSKATLNEPSSPRTSSGSSLWCQETMGIQLLRLVAEVIKIAQVSTASEKVSSASATTTTADDLTLAQALADLKSTKPKAKRIAFREPGESTTTISLHKSQDKGKGIMVEPEKPLKKKVQIMLDEEVAIKLQAEIDEEERITRAEEEKIDEANIAWDDIQAKVDVDYQLAKRLQAEEQEQFIIEQKATLFKELLEQRRKHFAAKRAEEKRNKPPTKKSTEEDHDYLPFKRQKVDEDKDTSELQSLMEITPDEEEVTIDVVPLAVKSPRIVNWKIHKEGKKSYYQIIIARYGSTRPVEDLDVVLWNDLKNMFEPQDAVYTDLHAGRKEISPYTTYNYRYAEQEASVTAALIDVNAAQSKLVLLENFNENYSKCLRLLYKVNAAEGVNAASEEVSTAECYMEAQGFCSGDRVCLLAELGGGYLRLEAHWCMSSFWSSLVLSDSKRVFLIRILLRLYLFQLGGARRACVKAVILCTWDYFPTAKRRWRLLDMVYTRLIACSIAGRSQASEKVTVTDLFYLRVLGFIDLMIQKQ
ncbi:uncharacterized mitochondrial protein-like protein [Tanacetum coccineum]|uniref:Uncharacterized mitochondrial protein-like protein n=1 Tax=Tanacetum coccineum TaxID=301880 RepID=A0ABQ5I0R8_9ASTR